MKPIKAPFFVCACLFFLLYSACSSQKNITSNSTDDQEKKGSSISDLNIEEVKDSPLDGVPPDEKLPPIPPKDNLPPESYLIVGRISMVQDNGSYGYNKGKCGKEPCFANIKVEKLIQTGMGVTTDLSIVKEVTVFFPNGLNGFKYGKTTLEPLTEADRVSALIQLSQSSEAWAKNDISHTIIKYTKL